MSLTELLSQRYQQGDGSIGSLLSTIYLADDKMIWATLDQAASYCNEFRKFTNANK